MIFFINLCSIIFFDSNYYYSYFDFIIYSLLTLLPLLISVAFFTLAERKVMASIQRRTGPNLVGFIGFLQPFADGLKLVVKEVIIPTKSNNFLFVFSPLLTLLLSFIG
jgi:NADH:ubiquinone oxidoreductase subunit H